MRRAITSIAPRERFQLALTSAMLVEPRQVVAPCVLLRMLPLVAAQTRAGLDLIAHCPIMIEIGLRLLCNLLFVRIIYDVRATSIAILDRRKKLSRRHSAETR